MEKINCHNNNYHEKILEVKDWNISPSEKKKVLEFFKDYELGKVTGKRGSNPEANLLRNLYYLKVGLENVKSETPKEVEIFLENLLKDSIKWNTFNKKTQKTTSYNYALKTKKAIIKTMNVYYNWKKKDNLSKILDLDISLKKNDFEILSDEEIEKLIGQAQTLDKKYLISVLNSSGMRAEEFHNVRFEDIVLPEKNNNKEFVIITIKNQYSKTLGRTISLYDKKCTPIVKKYLSKRIEEGIKPKDPIFPLGYNGTRKYLNRLGKLTINKSIHYHMFRHTAATRLCSKMNRQQLCVYFGWKFSSPMPDVYIERAGVNMDDVENKFKASMMEELQEKIDELKDFIKLQTSLNPILIKLFTKEKILKEDYDTLANLLNKTSEKLGQPTGYKTIEVKK